ncbi:MAG: c-type cytochrome [Gammaproteobacteria bacterium]|nr:c-type cytochrome [Gammaproteobacteria bacterium]
MSRAFVLFVVVLLAACGRDAAPPRSAHDVPPAPLAGPLTALPHDLPVDAAKAALGGRLFRDKRLSADDSVACLSCHDLEHGGADALRTARGIGGQAVPRNSPTVFNAAMNFRQFWDGRAATLAEQAAGPITSPVEMGSKWQVLSGKLAADAGYRRAFAALYSDGITPRNVTDAIAEFERTLLTPDSPFDRYLRGEEGALSADAQRGWRLFRDRGCAACHQGANVGGNLFQVFGVLGDYFADRGHDDPSDQGRFNVTHDERDRHVFKVPALRNVAATAPYFHDGSAATLPDAVRTMARYQLGIELAADEVDAIVSFLGSLSGCYQGRCL